MVIYLRQEDPPQSTRSSIISSSTTSSNFSTRAFPHHWSGDIYCISPLSFDSNSSDKDKTYCLSATLSIGSSALSDTTHEQLANRYTRSSISRRTLPLQRSSVRRSQRWSRTPHQQLAVQRRPPVISRSPRNRRDSIGGAEFPFDPTGPKYDYDGRDISPLPLSDFDPGAFPRTHEIQRIETMEGIEPVVKRRPSVPSLRQPLVKKSPGIHRKPSYHSFIRRESQQKSWQKPGQPPKTPSIHLVLPSVGPESSEGRTGRSSSLSDGETHLPSMHSLSNIYSGHSEANNSGHSEANIHSMHSISSWGRSSSRGRRAWDPYREYRDYQGISRKRRYTPERIRRNDDMESQSACRACVIL